MSELEVSNIRDYADQCKFSKRLHITDTSFFFINLGVLIAYHLYH